MKISICNVNSILLIVTVIAFVFEQRAYRRTQNLLDYNVCISESNKTDDEICDCAYKYHVPEFCSDVMGHK